MLEKNLKKVKESLDNCKNPLYFFDDDVDGLCSFLLLYRYKKEGHGIPLKTRKNEGLSTNFLRKVLEYNPDIIFVLDIINISEDFLEKVKIPIVWIDHHPPKIRDYKKYNNLLFVNPILLDKNNDKPTTFWCYEILDEEHKKKDLWLATAGCVGDYYIPNYLKDFKLTYPNYVDEIDNIVHLNYNTLLGKLIKIMWFNMKGSTKQVIQSIKVMTRIQNPDEIVKQETARGRFIYKRYEKILLEYNNLLANIRPKRIGKLLVYVYESDKMSLTTNLANELSYKNPEKIIIVARKRSGEYKCSIRSTKTALPEKLAKAIDKIEATGGGHIHACGAVVKEKHWELFLKRFSKLINKK